MTSCCGVPFKRRMTAKVDGMCRSVLEVKNFDSTGAVTISYEYPTVPPTPVTGTVVLDDCIPTNDPPPPEPPHDFEVVIRCAPDGSQILLQYDVSVAPMTVVAMIDATTGTPWTGDITTLVKCPSGEVESDPVLMCDGGVQFIRHITKKQGEPTGAAFDTDLKGALYTVTNEAAVTVGACAPAVAPFMGSTSAAAFTPPVECTSFAVSKPECCELAITTSVGEITLQVGVTSYATQVYKDPFTVTAVTATGVGCDPAEVSLTFNRS